MLNKIAYIYGVFFLLIGILGFVPAVAPNDLLFGYFHVNGLHNIVHLVTGAVALGVGYYSYKCWNPRTFFQVFGVIYAIVAILGFWFGNAPIMGIANNIPDAVFHAVVALVSLYFGFVHSHVD